MMRPLVTMTLLLGCSRAAAPLRAPTSATTEGAHSPTVAPWLHGSILVDAVQTAPVVVGVEADGRLDLIMGGTRLTAADEEMRFAEHFFLGTIVHAWQLREGWVFVTNTGATARSDTFLGPLTPMRDLDVVETRARRAISGADTPPLEWLPVFDRDGHLWSTHGRDDWSRVELPIPGHVRDLASMPGHTAVIVDSDLILHTADEGRHWALVPGVRAARLERRRAVLSLSDHEWLDATNPVVHTVRPDDPLMQWEANDDAVPPASIASIRRRLDRRRVFAEYAHPFPDGNVLQHSGDALDFYEAATGHLLRRRRITSAVESVGIFPRMCADGSLQIDAPSAEDTGRFSSRGEMLDAREPCIFPQPAAHEEWRRPAHARSVDFADTLHGVAYVSEPHQGARPEVMRTTDGGFHWSSWQLPIVGSYDADSLGLNERSAVRCWPTRCAVGRFVVWSWEDEQPYVFARQRPRLQALPGTLP